MRDRHPPFMIQRAASHAFGNTALSAIGLSVAKHAVGHPGLTGVALVEDGIDAFAIRSRLIAAAERSIDLQYYIWRDDLTGNLLLEDLRRAAARGVRVRLLVDDNGIPGLDRKLRWLASDRNFEIRISIRFETDTSSRSISCWISTASIAGCIRKALQSTIR